MYTDVQTINFGLSKIAQSRVTRIDPPISPLEVYMSLNYPQWKRAELAKRRWVFATEYATLTAISNVETTPGFRKYKYPLPNDCLRPIRDRNSEWKQMGRFIYSAYSTLTIPYIRNVPESEWDPLFTAVMAYKIAFESAEYVTQSTAKKESAKEDYKQALIDAGKANAFVIGPEDLDEEFDEMTWLESFNYA